MKAFKILSILAVTLLMAACGGQSVDSVAEKIDSGKKLTQADYTTIIDYCGQFADEAQKLQNQVDALPDSSSVAVADETKLADLKTRFPHLDKFNAALLASTPEEVGAGNVKKVNKLAQYIWFTAPDWATIQTDPKVDGFIEQTPTSDTTGVISAGAGDIVTQ